MHGSLHNPILTESLHKLDRLGVQIIPPKIANGKNNLPEEKKRSLLPSVAQLAKSTLKDISILVTGGPNSRPPLIIYAV